MKLYLKPKVWIVGVIVMAGTLRLSYWQWERHLAKQDLIARLDTHLQIPPTPLSDLLKTPPHLPDLLHRRVLVAGSFDFDHEMLLANRRYQQMPGMFLLTPLKLEGREERLLVSRGFIPLELSSRSQRESFHSPKEIQFVGLIKEPLSPRFLAPRDEQAGPGLPWVDRWLRVDLQSMQRQLPYPLLPFFVELMDGSDLAEIKRKIVPTRSDRDELMSLATRQPLEVPDLTKYKFPVPVYDIVTPPGRHLGYVYEWALMAVATFLICFVLSLRPTGYSRSDGRI